MASTFCISRFTPLVTLLLGLGFTIPGLVRAQQSGLSATVSEPLVENSFAATQVITIEATADATVCLDLSHPCINENYGLPGAIALTTTNVVGANKDGFWIPDPCAGPNSCDEPFMALIQFDLMSIPSGATITNAELHLSGLTRDGSPGREIEIRPITESWNESSVTGLSSPGLSNPVFSYFHRDCFGSCIFDITGLVTEWYSGTRANHGLALFPPTAHSDPNFFIAYRSRHASIPDSRPRLVITIQAPNNPPSITRVNPSSSNVTVTVGESVTFDVSASDSDGTLDFFEWYIDNVFQENHPASGNPDTDSWSHTFNTLGGFDIFAYVYDDDGASAFTFWQVSVENPAEEYFDDFLYTSQQEMLTATDATTGFPMSWNIRTGTGGPGFGIWESGNVIPDGNNSLVTLLGRTIGESTSTLKAQIFTPEVFLEGTYAAMVRFSDAPNDPNVPDGDAVVETFFAASPFVTDDPNFSETDFEYYPNSPSVNGSPQLDCVTWEIVSDPRLPSDNLVETVPGSLAGWHLLLVQITGGSVLYYVDGNFIVGHGEPYFPESNMGINFNIWFSELLNPSDERQYSLDIDWVYHAKDEVLNTSAVQDIVVTLRSEDVPRRNTFQDLLPVELVSFDALLDGNSILLIWETASETNNAGFEVQHRHLGGGNTERFSNLAFLEGHGTTLEPQFYSYHIAELEFGTHAFRLKQIDFDGTFEYSPVVEVVVEMAERFVVKAVYPNPFNGQAQVRFAVQRQQRVRVELYDMLGRRVQILYDGEPSAGVMQTVSINGNELPSGQYVVRVMGASFMETRMVTLTK